MEWLFAHMEDPGERLSPLRLASCIVYLYHLECAADICYCSDIDDPIPATGGGSGGAPEPSAEQISMLADMGFTAAQARKALRETVSTVCYEHLSFELIVL